VRCTHSNTAFRSTRRLRRGYTLLELVAATFMVAAIVIPSMSLMRHCMEYSSKIESRNAMTTLCAGKLEQHLALGAVTFTNATARGDFTAEGYPALCYRVQRSQNAADGGIPNRLMAVWATVWEDSDGDRSPDTDELEVSLAGKVAKIAGY